MKTTPLLALLAALLLPMLASAQSSGKLSFGKPTAKAAESSEFVTVQAKGQGETVDAAKKDAARNAIKKAVGELVDARTLVENDELVEDRILTLSNAMIEKADYGDARNIGDGLFEVPVTAVVKKGRLNQELKAIGITTGDLAGDSLSAAMFTGKERLANAERFFAERFDGFPQNVVEGVLLSNKDGTPAVVPDPETGHVFADVAFRVNPENYAAWTQSLMELLRAVATKTEDSSLSFQDQKSGPYMDPPPAARPRFSVNGAIVIATPKKPERNSWPVSVFWLDKSMWGALKRALDAKAPRDGFIEVILKDEEGDPICSGRASARAAGVEHVYQDGVWTQSYKSVGKSLVRPGANPIPAVPIVGAIDEWRQIQCIAPWTLGLENTTNPRVFRAHEGLVKRRIDLGEVSEDDLAEVAGYEVKVTFE